MARVSDQWSEGRALKHRAQGYIAVCFSVRPIAAP